MDCSITPILQSINENNEVFLTDALLQNEIINDECSGKLKTDYKKQLWDENKSYAVQVSNSLFSSKNDIQKTWSRRIRLCANLLEYGWVEMDNHQFLLKLKTAKFCRVRFCPVCQWRRSLMWVSRFFDSFSRIHKDYPKMRYIFVTFTVANVPVTELHQTVAVMGTAWKRLIKYKSYPALGFVRSLEVTKEKDLYEYKTVFDEKTQKTVKKKTDRLIRKARPDYCHPHFHVLMAVPSSYFARDYLSKDDWALMWQKALRADYKPVCDVRVVKPCKKSKQAVSGDYAPEKAALDAIMSAVTETVKYSVKPSDMVSDSSWFLEVADQLHKTRAVALGGVFKEYFSVDNEDFISEPNNLETKKLENKGGLMFSFRQHLKRYQRSKFFETKVESD